MIDRGADRPPGRAHPPGTPDAAANRSGCVSGNSTFMNPVQI
jgi:hypothetical protein